MKPILPSLMLALLAAFGASAALAEKADRDKPLNIESDALRYDDLHQTSVFTGRVVATKGTIVVRGERVEVQQDPEGFQHAVVTAAPGERAFYRQKRDGVDEYIEGEGDTIIYDGRADRVRFIGRAELRRYRGAELSDRTSGSVIVYDNVSDVFTVEGAAPDAKPSNPGGRVRAVLSPRAEPAKAPAGAPAAPLAPSPRLREGRP